MLASYYKMPGLFEVVLVLNIDISHVIWIIINFSSQTILKCITRTYMTYTHANGPMLKRMTLRWIGCRLCTLIVTKICISHVYQSKSSLNAKLYNVWINIAKNETTIYLKIRNTCRYCIDQICIIRVCKIKKYITE